MSATLLECLQQKMEAELEEYRAGLISQGTQAVVDNAYELSVKCELAARLDCAFLDRNQLKGLLKQESSSARRIMTSWLRLSRRNIRF